MHASLRTTAVVAGMILMTSLSACSRSPVGGETMTKDQARELGGKGDDGSDLCATEGWYGDGVCDDFCLSRDPDCTVATGSPCGGLLGGDCPTGTYCRYDESAQCGAADQTGTCETRIPAACPEIYSPVCGCDGRTYGNECEAQSAGASIASRGECGTVVDGGPGPDGPAGTLCGTRGASDCSEGEFCDFPSGTQCGAADEGGTCRPMPQACTREYAPVCGCDGQTYGNDCSANAAGVSVAFAGECEPVSGAFCGGLAGAGCADGEYCAYSREAICGAADASGTCQPRPEACTQEYAPVCGCDGQTYSNACTAAGSGTSVSYDGECKSTGKSCGGKRVEGTGLCAADEYCDYTPEAICGYADATGTCQPRPQACTFEYAPVCGCDGQTYSNDCAARSAGTGIYHTGECKTR